MGHEVRGVPLETWHIPLTLTATSSAGCFPACWTTLESACWPQMGMAELALGNLPDFSALWLERLASISQHKLIVACARDPGPFWGRGPFRWL